MSARRLVPPRSEFLPCQPSGVRAALYGPLARIYALNSPPLSVRQAEVSFVSGNLRGFMDSGEATLRTSEVLDVTISDSGDVNYYGHPRIRQRITDSGKLTSLGE